MKNTGRFSLHLDGWIDRLINEMAEKERVSKNYIINQLLRSKLEDMGYIENIESHIYDMEAETKLSKKGNGMV